MAVNNPLFLQADDLGAIPSGRTLDDELVRPWSATSWTATTPPSRSRRGGPGALWAIANIATADPDLRRARLDFDVYTWL